MQGSRGESALAAGTLRHALKNVLAAQFFVPVLIFLLYF